MTRFAQLVMGPAGSGLFETKPASGQPPAIVKIRNLAQSDAKDFSGNLSNFASQCEASGNLTQLENLSHQLQGSSSAVSVRPSSIDTTFLELTFPNSGCRSAATLRLFRSSTYQYVRFVFWLEA